MRKPLFLTCVMLCASSATAQAVGFRTQMSCAGDYYAYCSQHAPGSPGVRKCMRAVGPKLSKACINALIADGEVSKAEVEAQKQKLAGAKAKPKTTDPKKTDVAATKKAQPDVKKDVKKSEVAEKKTDAAPKKVTAEAKATAAKAVTAALAPKVTAAAQAPKPAAAALATAPAVAAVTPAPEAEPVPQAQSVSLDEETFAALKNRGTVFVAEDEGTAVAEQPQASPAEPASDTAAVPNGDAWQAGTETEPAAVASETEEAPAAGEAADVATAGEEAGGQTVEYPPGRMSLGRKLSSATADPEPSSWWDRLVEAVTGE